MYSVILYKISSSLILSILFKTKITGDSVFLKTSIINLSPGPNPVDASTTNKRQSISFTRDIACLLVIFPSLLTGLIIPGVSINTI